MKDIFSQGSAWIDGKFVKLSEARIPILDWVSLDLMLHMM